MMFVKQGATRQKVEERIGEICVGDSEHMGLAGAGILESRFGKGKWTQIGQSFGCQGGGNVLLFQAPSYHLRTYTM